MTLACLDSNCLGLGLQSVREKMDQYLNRSDISFLIPDEILGEQVKSSSWKNVVAANLQGWIPFIDRIYPGRHYSELLGIELKFKRPIHSSEIINVEKTEVFREFLRDIPRDLDLYDSGINKGRSEALSSGIFNGGAALAYYRSRAIDATDIRRELRKRFQHLLISPEASSEMNIAIMIGYACASTAKDLYEIHNWELEEARAFSFSDSFHFRYSLSFAVRNQIIGNGIGENKAINHVIDCDFCTVATYADLFFSNDSQNIMQIDVMRRALAILSGISKNEQCPIEPI